MKVQAHKQHGLRAMTLVELFLAVFVILILAGMLLPVTPNHGPGAKNVRARMEMADLATAIEAYEKQYNQLPIINSNTNEDITFGIGPADISDFKKVGGTRLIVTNSDLVVILMDFDLGANAGNKLNQKRIKFLNATLVEGTNSSGVSIIDHQYRDPWGKPYIISLDANQDGFARDAVFSNPSLYENQGPTTLTNINGVFEWRGKVMVWSRGSDGKTSINAPANGGVNKDNVVSWE